MNFHQIVAVPLTLFTGGSNLIYSVVCISVSKGNAYRNTPTVLKYFTNVCRTVNIASEQNSKCVSFWMYVHDFGSR